MKTPDEPGSCCAYVCCWSWCSGKIGTSGAGWIGVRAGEVAMRTIACGAPEVGGVSPPDAFIIPINACWTLPPATDMDRAAVRGVGGGDVLTNWRGVSGGVKLPGGTCALAICATAGD
jgi:hypothetical protein